MKNREIKVNYTFSLYSLIRRGLGIGIIILLISLYTSNRFALQEQITLNEALQDTVQVWKGKDGLNRAKITVLETRDSEDFIKLATKDSAVLALQQEVKDMKRYLRRQGSVTNFDSNTDIDTSSPTEVVDNPDKPEFPSYKSKFNLNGWVVGESFATVDSTFLDLKIKNSYSLTVGREPTGFLGLGKGTAFAQVRNDNPYSITSELRTYQVSLPPPKKFGIGVFVGYGISSDLKIGPLIGAGVSYNILRF